MLVLSRKCDPEIYIGPDIAIKVLEIRNGRVTLGIEAPRELSVWRGELLPIIDHSEFNGQQYFCRSEQRCSIRAQGGIRSRLIVRPSLRPGMGREMFSTTSHDFGIVAQGAKAEYAFVLENLYVEEVHIAGVRASCSCTKPEIQTPTLKTHEKGAILATYNTAAFLGAKGANVDRHFR